MRDNDEGEQDVEPLKDKSEPEELPTDIEAAACHPDKNGFKLSWSKIEVMMVGGDDGIPKSRILNNVSGKAQANAVTAILGHSGAGKTTLLSALSGRLVPDNNMVATGEIKLNSKQIDPTDIETKRKIAFVDHSDAMLATATPREALRFSARLRLAKAFSDNEIDDLVTKMLQDLRLDNVADSRIGGPHFRGLSSGEMRRVSLGTELIVKPRILFLDEITSGLDSHNTLHVMEVLKHVATRGTSVLMTIHQPSTKAFSLIDYVILMNKGKCIYQGRVKEVPERFESHGFPIPANYNPAEWILDVSQQLDEAQADRFVSSARARQSSIFPNKRRSTLPGNSRVFWTTELKEQLLREFKNLQRDHHALKLRFMISIGGSALVALIFNGVAGSAALDSEGFQSHVGAVFFLCLMTMITLQVTILDFIDQRPLFVREFETDHFRMLSYGISKVLIEAVNTFFFILFFMLIVYWALGLQGRFWNWVGVLFTFDMALGAIGVGIASYAKDPRSAKELIPVLILPQILFCGFFVSSDSLATWLQWAQWIMPLTYAFRLLLAEEFSSCVELPRLATHSLCASYLEAQNATGEKDLQYWLTLVGLFVVLRVAGLYALRRNVAR